MENSLLEKYESLPYDQQALVNQYINEMLEMKDKKKKKSNSKRIKDEMNLMSTRIISTTIKSNENPKNIFGILKGKIKMSDDFDDELEEFKDYR